MANTETSVTELKINKLTKAQYEGIVSPSNTELYFVKDEAIDYNDLANTPNLAPVALSGDYDDLINAPEIDQSDWNQTDIEAIDFIKNKPNLANVAISGSYPDLINKPTIPTTTDSVSQGSTDALTSGGAYTNLITTVEAGSTADKINVTKNGTTSTITVNNVASATSATTASKLGNTTVGSTSRPIYLNNGTATQINYTIEKSVPADAKFTDTTYGVFNGATSSVDGASGLVKKPVIGDQDKFLKGDGTWSVVDSFPSQSGNSGKFLTTNGTSVNWASLTTSNISDITATAAELNVLDGITVSTTELNYTDGVTSNIQTQINDKVSKSGDSMSNDLEMTNGSIYLEGIGSNVASSTSRLNLGTPTNVYAYLTGNNQGAFGIYSERSGSRTGIACYPGQNFFADAATKTIDLGRSNNVWKTGYIDTLSDGTNSISIANIINKVTQTSDPKKIYGTDASGNQTTISYSNTINASYLVQRDSNAQIIVPEIPIADENAASKKYVDDGLALKANTTDLASVALSGSYNDLSNKPTINSITLSDNKTSSDLGLQSELVSGTNIKTINNNSLLGSGNITIDSLPVQSGQSGKYLTTDGTVASWATVDALPSQTGNNGKYLTTDGTYASWNTLATVATSGSYSDLSDKPTIDDLTTPTQQAALNSGANSTNIGQIATNTSDISTINGKIPSQASTSNQLADKAFVNSSINAMAAYYITSDAEGDAFATKADLDTGPYYHDGSTRIPTENDYAIVAVDETHDNACTRYAYTGSQWSFQYIVNDTPFTQAQIDAINSGINSTMVGYLTNVTSDIQTQINGKQAAITGGASTITSNNLTASRAVISNDSGKVAVSDTTSTELGYVHGVTSAIQTQIDSKLEKTTYEWNKELNAGSSGYVCIGKFSCYDTNITVEISCTTRITYYATLVVAMQNVGSTNPYLLAEVHGDVNDNVTPNIYIYKHDDTVAGDGLVEIYFKPLPWSKNLVHIQAMNLRQGDVVKYPELYSDILTKVSSIPEEATRKPTNVLKTELDKKQNTLVSGTNIKTVNNQSVLGSGNLVVDGLPSQASQSGKFLTTDGTTASWVNIPTELPSQSGQNGKYLTTNGTSPSWVTVGVLPSQSGQAGKYLTTNGTSAAWATVGVLPSQSGQSGKYLTTNGTSAAWVAIEEYTANEVETLWNSL